MYYEFRSYIVVFWKKVILDSTFCNRCDPYMTYRVLNRVSVKLSERQVSVVLLLIWLDVLFAARCLGSATK